MFIDIDIYIFIDVYIYLLYMTVEHSATYVLSMELHLSPRLPLERVHLLACYDRLLERILSPHSKSHTIPIFGEIMIDPLIHRSVTQRLPNPSLYPIQKIERHPSCPEQTSVQIPRLKGSNKVLRPQQTNRYNCKGGGFRGFIEIYGHVRHR